MVVPIFYYTEQSEQSFWSLVTFLNLSLESTSSISKGLWLYEFFGIALTVVFKSSWHERGSMGEYTELKIMRLWFCFSHVT